jgi:hypothetical protein
MQPQGGAGQDAAGPSEALALAQRTAAGVVAVVWGAACTAAVAGARARAVELARRAGRTAAVAVARTRGAELAQQAGRTATAGCTEAAPGSALPDCFATGSEQVQLVRLVAVKRWMKRWVRTDWRSRWATAAESPESVAVLHTPAQPASDPNAVASEVQGWSWVHGCFAGRYLERPAAGRFQRCAVARLPRCLRAQQPGLLPAEKWAQLPGLAPAPEQASRPDCPEAMRLDDRWTCAPGVSG